MKGEIDMMTVQVNDQEKMMERLSSYQALLSMLGYEDRREEEPEEAPESMGLGAGGGCLL